MTIARISQLAAVSSVLCFCVWTTRAPLLAQDRSFTIDQVLSAPFPTDLIAAPSHGRIAWVSKRIGIWGGSYGGLMTALAMARDSDTFAAGVDYAGVHDWSTLLPFLKAPGAPPEAARMAWESSPLSSMKTWRSPVLVVQGDDDRNVEFSQSVQLIESLRKQGVEFEQIAIPDEVHGLILYRNLLAFFEATDDFLHRHLSYTRERK
jgi:dipeptidyl aminopeptidase/acylaminoacyl peptidase